MCFVVIMVGLYVYVFYLMRRGVPPHLLNTLSLGRVLCVHRYGCMSVWVWGYGGMSVCCMGVCRYVVWGYGGMGMGVDMGSISIVLT
jgi:hypothetical protein